MKYYSIAILSLSAFCAIGSSLDTSDKETIEQVLVTQAKCWNDGDIDGFMKTYWKSDNLTFSGGGKTTRGWQATLDRYKKSYPKSKMGKLKFDGLEVTMLSDDAALVLGFWHLTLPGKDGESELKEGNFSLVLRKMEGQWKIIHDHSSTDESKEGDLSKEATESSD